MQWLQLSFTCSWFTCLNNINSWSVTRDASRFQKEWAGYFNLWCRDYCLFETQSTRVVTLTRPDEQQSTLIHVYTQFIDTCGHIKWTFCYACLWTTMQMWWANVRLHRTKVYYSRQVDTFFIRKTPLITSEYSDGSLMPSVVAFFFFSKVVMRLVALEKAKLDSIVVPLVGSIL